MKPGVLCILYIHISGGCGEGGIETAENPPIEVCLGTSRLAVKAILEDDYKKKVKPVRSVCLCILYIHISGVAGSGCVHSQRRRET